MHITIKIFGVFLMVLRLIIIKRFSNKPFKDKYSDRYQPIDTFYLVKTKSKKLFVKGGGLRF